MMIKSGKKGEYYMSAYGIIELKDNEGSKIWSYNNEVGDDGESDFEHFINTYNYDIENGKDETADAVKNEMKYAYTIDSIGTIKMYCPNMQTTENIYKYNGEELVHDTKKDSQKVETAEIDYYQYISKYVMPMDFLVSLLEMTASSEFIGAICDLIQNEHITLVVDCDEIVTVQETTERYADEVTVKGIQPAEKTIKTVITTQNGNETTTTTNESKHPRYDLVKEVAGVEGERNVEKTTRVTKEKTDYSIYVKEAVAWYGSAKYEADSSIDAKYTAVNESGDEVINEKDYGKDANIDDVLEENDEEYHIWVPKNENSESVQTFKPGYPIEDYMINYEKANQRYQNAWSDTDVNDWSSKDLSNNDDSFIYKLLGKVVTKTDFFSHGKNTFNNPTTNTTTNTEDGQNSVITEEDKYTDIARVAEMIQKKSNVQTSKFTKVVTKSTTPSNKAIEYTDNTDQFLGLLKNDTGTYVKGAKFNPSGKKVVYKDVYEGTKESSAGDLLVNGADALIQFMESTSEYNKNLVAVMKYILQRYTGESYGIKDFESVVNWIDIFGNTDFQPGTAIDCLRQWMTSYEGNITNDKGNKYKLLDGFNNDDFHSISTAHGFMFYAAGYNGFAHEGAMNRAYKDFKYNMTLKKAVGDLITSGGIDTSGVTAYNSPIYHLAYPEKYDLPVEVVDRAHMYRLSEELQNIKKEIEEYNKKTGKNVKMTLDQMGAMVDAQWQYGPGGFPYSEFIAAYAKFEGGVSNENIEDLRYQFLPFHDSKYEKRSTARWKLFKEGIYQLSDGTELKSVPEIESYTSGGGAGGPIVEAAKKLVELTKMGGTQQTSYNSVRKSTNGFSSGVYVCASFVSEVLYNSNGFKSWSDSVDTLGINLYKDPNYELIYYNATPSATASVGNFAQSKNLDKNIEDIIQDGDIVATYSSSYSFQHVVVYIGNNQFAHHGGGSGATNYPNVASNFFARYNKGSIKYIFRYKK